MKRKLIAFDLDGTLLTSEKKIAPTTKAALRQLRADGHYVTIATGRSKPLTEEVIAEGEFSHYILCNGALAFTDHQKVFENPLDLAAFGQFVAEAEAQALDVAYLNLEQVQRNSSFQIARMQRAMESFGSVLPKLGSSYQAAGTLYQALAFYKEEERYLDLAKYPEFRFVRWHEEAVDVLPYNGSKALALTEVARLQAIAKEDLVVFGDGNNDVEMLEAAGTGIVMGNAHENVKAFADFVTKSHDEDGIVHALKKLGLLS